MNTLLARMRPAAALAPTAQAPHGVRRARIHVDMRLFARARSSDASVVERDATRSNVTTIIFFLFFYSGYKEGATARDY